MKSSSQSWKLAYINTILSKSSQVSDTEFDLDQVKGKVVVTKEAVVPAFQMLIVKGSQKLQDIRNMFMCWWNHPLNVKTYSSWGIPQN